MTTSSWGEGTPLTPSLRPRSDSLAQINSFQLQWFHTSFLGPKWKVVLPLFIAHSSFLIVLALNRQTRLGYNDFGAFGRPAPALAWNGPPSKQSLSQTSNDLIWETDEILNTFALHHPQLHPNFCYLSRHLTNKDQDQRRHIFISSFISSFKNNTHSGHLENQSKRIRFTLSVWSGANTWFENNQPDGLGEQETKSLCVLRGWITVFVKGWQSKKIWPISFYTVKKLWGRLKLQL